ncbi:ectonucleoside triphosphate diphosphohydrolase 1-like isoform X2 [Branchiostoma lanceolatum]|uniref:ectonucleoside triphosphate diphosphohydrolase 1-like isoform X2 n=1 Tax=Branchiostoma lanceolatum TaxID=7740 RepID=UPI0034529559
MEPNLRVCFVLSVFLGVIVFVSSARVGRASHNYRYGVIFDAGSSSTKLHVYRWDRNSLPTKKADLTELKLSGTRKVRPGISSYVASPQFVKTALILLLYSAKAAVPKELHSSTPVYLKATAGMRLLKPADADAIFDQINELFQNPTFNPFKFERGWAKVISGEEEGVYGWITVNFLKGVFDSKTDMKTFGALDMGGGSTQITFLPTGQFYANLFPLYIAGKRYDLYTNSFLKFGLDQFRLQMYQYLYQQATDKNATIENPCDLQGYNSAVDIGDSKVAKIKGGFTSVNNIQGKTDDFCALSYAQATNQSGEYGYTRCAAGNYIAALLSDGYKIDRNATDKVYITEEINGVEIGWALGSMMYELYLLNIQFATGSASHVTATSLDLILASLSLMWTS